MSDTTPCRPDWPLHVRPVPSDETVFEDGFSGFPLPTLLQAISDLRGQIEDLLSHIARDAASKTDPGYCGILTVVGHNGRPDTHIAVWQDQDGTVRFTYLDRL